MKKVIEFLKLVLIINLIAVIWIIAMSLVEHIEQSNEQSVIRTKIQDTKIQELSYAINQQKNRLSNHKNSLLDTAHKDWFRE